MRLHTTIIAALLCVTNLLATQPERRLFDFERREGDPRPKLTPPSPSPRGEGKGEGAVTPSPAGKGPGVRSVHPSLSIPLRSGEGRVRSKAPGWQPNGIIVCDTANCSLPKIVPDGNSGAIVCWTENHRGADSVNRYSDDIYAQRVDSGGNFVWASQGVPVCSLSGSWSNYPAMISDGRGGAIIAWEDNRGGLGYTRVFAQRLDSLGNRLWTENGVLVCNQMSGYVDLCTDGQGGAIIAYVDGRDQANTSDNIYAQRIDSAGNPVWAIDGVPVCTADSIQFWPFISSNRNGGAIITWWDDYRNGGTNMDACGQMLNSLGNIKWTINGETFSTKPGNQKSFKSISDNNGDALIGWYDYSVLNSYMQCIDSNDIKQWGDTGVVIGNYSKINTDMMGGYCK